MSRADHPAGTGRRRAGWFDRRPLQWWRWFHAMIFGAPLGLGSSWLELAIGVPRWVLLAEPAVYGLLAGFAARLLQDLRAWRAEAADD